MARGEHTTLDSVARAGRARSRPRRPAAGAGKHVDALGANGATAETGDTEAPADPASVELENLRHHLPGLEPERRITDWGRSERVERLVDRTLADFLYHLWFRCEVEGIENLPAAGGALLVSNHAGALPPDAPMIAKAVREEHPRQRPLNVAVDPAFKARPGLSMLLPKVGCVAAHPANLHRLLHDEEALVLTFPEGHNGPRKLFKDRYRLRRFGHGEFVASALRADVPIVPVCVVGAEEAAPIFARLDLLKRLPTPLTFPVNANFPHLGPLAVTGYLPAKFRIRFLEPVRIRAAPGDRGSIQTATEEVRARVQETLFEMVGARDSVWLG